MIEKKKKQKKNYLHSSLRKYVNDNIKTNDYDFSTIFHWLFLCIESCLIHWNHSFIDVKYWVWSHSELIGKWKNDRDFNPLQAPVQNPIFLVELGQLSDKNATQRANVLRDIQIFLGLNHSLGDDVLHSNIGKRKRQSKNNSSGQHQRRKCFSVQWINFPSFFWVC